MSKTNTLLADEMGIGKTIQVLGTINLLRSRNANLGRVLVVCPASIKINWAREAAKWLVHPWQIHIASSKISVPDEADFVIINYDILERSMPWITARTWDVLVVDEAHYVKNSKAKRTKAVKKIADKITYKYLLTGTPIVNRPIELFSLLEILKHPLANSFISYARRYCNATQQTIRVRGGGTRTVWDFSGSSHLDELQNQLRSSCMIRRLKKDVLTELPPKIRQVVELPANGMSDMVREEQAWLASYEDEVQTLKDEAEAKKEAGDQQGYEEAVGRLSERVRVGFNEMSEWRHRCAVAKLPAATDHIITLLDEVDKLVVFAHHHDVVDGLQKALDEASISSVVLTGRESQDEKQRAIDQFQHDPTIRVFIGSITAAGVGLTLTAASMVVFVELDWVPGNISQAEDRLHRIGQRDVVQVQHLVVDGTIDAKLAHAIVAKQKIIEQALDKDTTSMVEKIDLLTAEIEEKKRRSEAARKAEQTQLEAMTPELIAHIHLGIRMLAGVCDGAQLRDNMGFNGHDTNFGRWLALRSELGPKLALMAKRMLKKYHRQLGSDYMRIIWPDWDTAKSGNRR